MTSFEEFWDKNFGARFGKHDASPLEPFYSIGEACWEGAENNAFQRQETVCDKYAIELDMLSEENRRLRERELEDSLWKSKK